MHLNKEDSTNKEMAFGPEQENTLSGHKEECSCTLTTP